MKLLRDLVDIVKNSIDSEPDYGSLSVGLKVYVTGIFLEGIVQKMVDSVNDRAVCRLDSLVYLSGYVPLQITEINSIL